MAKSNHHLGLVAMVNQQGATLCSIQSSMNFAGGPVTSFPVGTPCSLGSVHLLGL